MRKQLLFGTTNQAKLDTIKSHLASLMKEVEVLSLNDVNIQQFAEESGQSMVENAMQKAFYYYQKTKMPTLALDSGLYFKNFEKDDPRQPGAFVRRVNGKELTDEEMIAYYSSLAKNEGGYLEAYYEHVYVIIDELMQPHVLHELLEDQSFLITTIPHTKRHEGFPIDSISIDKETKTYFYDLHDSETDDQSSLNNEKRKLRLIHFVKSALYIDDEEIYS